MHGGMQVLSSKLKKLVAKNTYSLGDDLALSRLETNDNAKKYLHISMIKRMYFLNQWG